MLQSSENYEHARHHFADHGIKLGSVSLDLARLLARKDTVVKQNNDGILYLFKKNGVTFVHGDVAGIEGVRHALSDWLDWMGLVDAGPKARLDRYIGYYEPYATSHEELDRDKDVQEEVRNVARAVANAVREMRAGKLSRPDRKLERPRPK